jgi:hypothetical protein
MTDQQQDHLTTCNRHQARLLANLEAADCPKVFRDAVREELRWLRSDVLEIDRHHGV